MSKPRKKYNPNKLKKVGASMALMNLYARNKFEPETRDFLQSLGYAHVHKLRKGSASNPTIDVLNFMVWLLFGIMRQKAAKKNGGFLSQAALEKEPGYALLRGFSHKLSKAVDLANHRGKLLLDVSTDTKEQAWLIAQMWASAIEQATAGDLVDPWEDARAQIAAINADANLESSFVYIPPFFDIDKPAEWQRPPVLNAEVRLAA